MAIAISQSPYPISFSRNLMPYQVFVTDSVLQYGGYAINVVSFIGAILDDATLKLQFDGFVLEIVFKLNPDDSGLQFVTGAASPTYMAQLASEFATNYYLDKNYTITAIVDNNGNDALQFTAKSKGKIFEFVTGTWANGTISQSLLAIDQINRPNMAVFVELWVQNNATFKKIYEQAYDIDSTFGTDFDISGILNSYLDADLPTTYPQLCTKSNIEYYIRVAEASGKPFRVGKIAALPTNRVLLGGTPYEDGEGIVPTPQTVTQGATAANDKALRLGDIARTVYLSEPQYLTFLNSRSISIIGAEISLQIEVTFADGTTQMLSNPPILSGILKGQTVQFCVGYQALNLALIDTTANKIASYKVRAMESGSPISKQYSYEIDRSYKPYTRYFTYINSLGAIDSLKSYGKGTETWTFARQTNERFLSKNYKLTDGKVVEFNNNASIKFDVASGWLKSRKDNRQWADFFSSRWKFHEVGIKRLPIIVNSKEIKLSEDSVGNHVLNFGFSYKFDSDMVSDETLEAEYLDVPIPICDNNTPPLSGTWVPIGWHVSGQTVASAWTPIGWHVSGQTVASAWTPIGWHVSGQTVASTWGSIGWHVSGQPIGAISCTAITAVNISGNSSVSGTSATYNSGYSPAGATAPTAYLWSIVGQGTSIQGANNGPNCSFNFGTSGNATITLTLTTCGGATVSTTKTVSQAAVVAGPGKVMFIRNLTGGNGIYEPDLGGFADYGQIRNQLLVWKSLGVEAVQLNYRLDTYSDALLIKNANWLIANGLKFSICFWARGSSGDGRDKLIHNDGFVDLTALDYSSPNIKAEVSAKMTSMANVINSNASYSSNFLYFIFGNGATEEFYNEYNRSNAQISVSPGNYTANSLAAWRQFLFAKYGVTAPYSIGGINTSGNMPLLQLDNSSPWQSLNNTLNTPAGHDWQYFVASELKKFFLAFKTPVKNINSNMECWFFPTTWYGVQSYSIEIMYAAIRELCVEADGVYSSCNTFGQFYENLKFIDSMIGTFGNTKKVAIEFDPDDSSFNGGGVMAQFGNVPLDFLGNQQKIEEAVKRISSNVEFHMNFAMTYGDGGTYSQAANTFPFGQYDQVTGWGAVMTYIKNNYQNGANRYNRTNAPVLTKSVATWIANSDSYDLHGSWVGIGGHNFGTPINVIINN
jgi:hypothetical protein